MKSRFLAIVLLVLAASSLVAQRSSQGMGPLLDRAEIKTGDTIPGELSLFREDGSEVALSEVNGGKYTVIVSGCLTCPIFHRSYPGVEAVYEDYKSNDKVQFFFMYKSLAHPELNGYVQPVTLEERLMHVKEAKRVLGTRIQWLCDGVDNEVRHALGFGPNTQVVIDPEGKVVHALGWSDGNVLREQLVAMVGDSETHTRVADLKLVKGKPFRQQRSYEASVLAKPEFSSELSAVKIVASNDGKYPLYVKPRVEVDQGVLNTGAGEMYLGFFLDPIHGVHWNNLAAPLRYELKLPDGSVISPAEGSAPVVAQESDGDPREFKLAVKGLGAAKTAELVFHYFACSKEEGWCLPVTQSYAISFERDRDGGGTNGRSFRYGGDQGGRQRGAGGPGREGAGASMRTRILEMDANDDGTLSKDELPDRIAERFDQLDLNEDGLLDENEIDEMMSRRGQQGGGGRDGARGSGARGPGAQRGGGQFDSDGIKERIMNSDADGDGKITKEELPAQMQGRFERMDTNGDGFAEESEIDEMLKNIPGQGGRGSRR